VSTQTADAVTTPPDDKGTTPPPAIKTATQTPPQNGVDTSGKARGQASLDANGDLVVSHADNLSKDPGSSSPTPQVTAQNVTSSDQWKLVDTVNGPLSLPASWGGK
jgi:hypothetical protein